MSGATLPEPVVGFLLETMALGVAVLRGEDFRFVTVNPAYQALDPERRFVGATVAQVWPELAGVVLPILRGVLDSGTPYQATDMRLDVDRHGKREAAYFTFAYHPLPADEQGERGILVTVTETTGRHQLVEFQRDFEAFLEQTTDFVYFKDRDSRFRFCSKTMAEVTGHASWRDMIGKHDLEVFPPDTARTYYEEELPIFAEGKPLLGKVDPYYDAAGRSGFVHTNKWPLFDEHGKVAGIFGISRDVTEQRRAEEALREADRELRDAVREREAAAAELAAVLEQCPVGITIARESASDRVERNRQARIMSGAPEDAGTPLPALGATLLDVDGTPIALEDLPLRRARRGERVERWELLLRRPDGSTIPIEVNAAPVHDAAGQLTSVVAAWQDITTMKKLERLRAEWNSVVAHDLRQPINSISLYAQLLMRKSEGWPEEVRHLVVEIKKANARLARMTGDLLDLSRLDSSHLALRRGPLDLEALVRECVGRIEAEAPERSFEVRVRRELPPIDGDADRLVQVMENLLTNAVKYSQGEAPIRVVLDRHDSGVAVEVVNEGVPLKPELLERLFRRFQRAGIAAHEAVPGVGLGLQIAQGLVEAHGGHISAACTASGTTTFSFTLPLASSGRSAPAP